MLNARRRGLITFVSVLVGLAAGGGTLGRDFYVAPDGTAQGDGSKDKPLDLATVLSDKSPVQPGDTVYLKGGRYDGPMSKNDKGIPSRAPFNPCLKGTVEKPIVVTSAPGALAHLNGTVETQADRCAFVHFVRLEIGDLSWDRLQEKHLAGTTFNTNGGEGLKLINCNIFGGYQGTGLWSGARNLEVYGNLVHDFGFKADSGGGHAFYMQNSEGTKTIERNIAYRSCGWLYDIYTQGGQIRGFDLLENIGYLAGHLNEQTSFSFGVAGWQNAERIRFIGNVAYQPRDTQKWRSNMRLIAHSKPEVVHRDAVVKDNYVMGAPRALVLGLFEDIEVTGNTLWATGFLNEISSGPSGSGIDEHPRMPELKNYRVDRNTYYENGNEKPFVYGRHEKIQPGEMFTFAQWQGMGLDRNSQFLPGRNGKPTGTKVFVFDNKYEPGRGNVAIFNWDGKQSVEVDLSKVLKEGQSYRIYNCLDISQTIGLAKPLIRSKFDGRPVSLPMRKAPECPDFDAFLVLQEWED
jgi:hypothetical protein